MNLKRGVLSLFKVRLAHDAEGLLRPTYVSTEQTIAGPCHFSYKIEHVDQFKTNVYRTRKSCLDHASGTGQFKQSSQLTTKNVLDKDLGISIKASFREIHTIESFGQQHQSYIESSGMGCFDRS